MATMIDVLVRLLKRTEEGQVPWETTARETDFLAVVGTMEATISSIGDDKYSLTIRNERGVPIDTITSPEPLAFQLRRPFSISDSVESQLRSLYRLARRKALNADEVLSRFISELGQ